MNRSTFAAVGASLLAMTAMTELAEAGKKTQLVSRDVLGGSANGTSLGPSLSKNGRYVAFESSASDLVENDNNGAQDVFVLDRNSGTIERVSLANDGSDADAGSGFPSISDDGRYVAFESAATDIVPGDTNGVTDIFVYDRKFDFAFRVSKSSYSDEGNALSTRPCISGDGTFVAFQSNATNLVTGDTNGAKDVFVRHLSLGVTRRVSVSSRGDQGDAESSGATLSHDGRYVVFVSTATNLQEFDANGVGDTFLHDTHTGRTRIVSTPSFGFGSGDAASFTGEVSDDGRYLYFASSATNLIAEDQNGVTDIFLHDLVSGVVTRISESTQGVPADANCTLGGISRDGRYAIFRSASIALVPGDTNGFIDAFVYDRKKGKLRRVSLAANGNEGNDTIFDPVLSADGKVAAFDSVADNFVKGDDNQLFDVFVRIIKP